jgi:hypothetical protein
MSTKLSTLYETDYYTWTRETARLLREGRLSEVDTEHLAEEVEDLGKSERRNFVGYLSQSFAHLIKYGYLATRYPDNARRWTRDAAFFLKEAMGVLEENPGLKGELQSLLKKSWETARGEIFRKFVDDFPREQDIDRIGIPARCPWSPEQVLSGEILPPEPEIPGPR